MVMLYIGGQIQRCFSQALQTTYHANVLLFQRHRVIQKANMQIVAAYSAPSFQLHAQISNC